MREHLEIRTLIPFKLVLYLHENEKYFDGNHGVVLDQVWELGRGEAECGDDLRIFFKLCQQSLLLVQGESVLVKNVQEFEPNRSLSLRVPCTLFESTVLPLSLLPLAPAD